MSRRLWFATKGAEFLIEANGEIEVSSDDYPGTNLSQRRSNEASAREAFAVERF